MYTVPRQPASASKELRCKFSLVGVSFRSNFTWSRKEGHASPSRLDGNQELKFDEMMQFHQDMKKKGADTVHSYIYVVLQLDKA